MPEREAKAKIQIVGHPRDTRMLRPARHGHGRGGAGGCAGAFLLLFFALLTMSTRRYDESLQRGVRARKKQRKCVFLNMFRIYGGQG
eukprot:1329256-Amorphochlora_amoeboformis.AAC.1